MVVQHNMQAMNANRMLNITTGQQAKSTEKLSSGYRINRAADDAAGLTISEKMRKQIRGLDQASTNAQDGVSSVQTAEGALTEVHSMLQRMNELAVQAANGTNSKESDRQAIQDEIDQLTTEIDSDAEGPPERSLYFTENPDFTAPSAGIHSRRFPGSRIFLYSSDPEHDLAAVPSSLFDVLHRYFAVHSPDDVVLWKDGILSFQTMENQPQPLTALCTPDDARDSKIIPFPTLSERQRILQ